MKPRLLAVLAITVGCSLAAMLAIRHSLPNGQMQETPSNAAPVAGTDNQPAADGSGGVHVVEVQLVEEVGATADAGEVTRRKVPAGMRLISIDVMPFYVEYLRPGDVVDLLVTTQELQEEDKVRTRIRTLVEFLEVFAIEELTADSDDAPPETRVVHLLARQEEVDRIRRAERDGVFCVVGRHPTDERGT